MKTDLISKIGACEQHLVVLYSGLSKGTTLHVNDTVEVIAKESD